MALKLILHYSCRIWDWKDIKILRDFRSEREKHINDEIECLEVAQYQWGARRSHVDENKVRQVIREWMENKPLNFLLQFRFADVLPFMDWLLKREIQIAYFSDYPAQKKLTVLQVPSGITVCATDTKVNRLKPDPTGLKIITQKLNLSPSSCLMIGNRDDRDGEAARRIGMPYLICHDKKAPPDKTFKTFKELYAAV